MRCAMCDKALTDKEVAWNEDINGWEPCTICLDIALDAAYGHNRPDDYDGVPLLDGDFDELDGLGSVLTYVPVGEDGYEW